MIGAPLAAAAAGYYVGGGGLEGESAEILQESALDPNQQKLWDAYAEYLQGQPYDVTPWGPTDYPAQGESWWTAPPSAQEAGGLGQLTEYLQQVPGQYKTMTGALETAMQGLSPEFMENLYTRDILPAQRRLFQEETLPGVTEAYARTGTFAGSDRAEAQALAHSRFGEQQGRGMYDAIMKGQEYGRQALGMAPSIYNYPLGAVAASQQFGALPRQLQQQEISARFMEMKRTQPGMGPIIDRIMQALGLTTQMGYGVAPQENPLIPILSSLIGAGGQVGGAAMMAAASDRRVKTDIKRVGVTDGGLPIYTFRFLGDPHTQMGVMAQDVEKVLPEAVIEIDGIKRVYYDKVR